MEENQGWVKIHRKLKETSFYTNSKILHLFIHLVLSANHKEKKFYWNGKETIIKKGELITGLNKLSKETGMSIQSIRTALTALKSTSTITIKSTNKFSIIQIVNYAKYQSDEEKSTSESTSKLTNNQQTNNKQLTTNNNDNNNNNIYIKYIYDKNQKKEFGNKYVNLILDTYKKYFGHTPTDKKPRFIANAFLRMIEKFKKEIEPYKKYSTDELIEKIFSWYNSKYDFKGDTLDVIRRKSRIILELTVKKYKKGGEKNDKQI